ncbi:MAG: fibronectin type III domain-containing protein [Bacteroidales bacterium]|nr:fibronectin type III domain-containing protein [Bacteroidales bacterium]
MKRFLIISFGILCLLSASLFAQEPTVSVDSSINVTITTAKVYGNLINKGSWTVNGKGFVYSTNPVPTKENGAAKNVSGTNVGSYNTTITGLAPGTTYYVRAYAKKGSGATVDTVYSSNTISFVTPQAVPPELSAPTVSNIGLMEATFTGQIIAKNDATIQTTKGFVYSTEPNPTFEDERATIGGTASSFPYTMSKDVSGLLSGTTYYVRTFSVIKYGAFLDTVYSEQTSFVTQHACGNIPFGTTFSEIGINEATVHFSKGLGQNNWEVEYGFAGHTPGEGESVLTSDTVVTLTNLEGGRSYSVFVRGVCGDDVHSEWSDIRTFTTVAPPCAAVSGIHTRDMGHSSAVIEWTPGSMSQTLWEVVFAKSTDPLPTTGVLIEGTPQFSPIGLTPQTEYKIKVRALCGEFESNWSEEFHFNTIQQGLEEAEIKSVSIYPNPTTGIVRFDCKDIAIEKWEIRNTQGQIIEEGTLLPETFAFGDKKGIFFIHITSSNGNKIEKIIGQ